MPQRVAAILPALNEEAAIGGMLVQLAGLGVDQSAGYSKISGNPVSVVGAGVKILWTIFRYAF